MNRLILMTCGTLCAFAGSLQAQGFDGAEVMVETLGYGENSELGSTNYGGSLQFGLPWNMGIGGDVAFYGYDALGLDARNVTLHGTYAVNPFTVAGIFGAQDSYDDLSSTLIGIEGATSFAGASIDGYLGQVDGDLAEGTIFGLGGAMELGPIGLTASYGLADIDAQASRLTIGGEWQWGLGPTIYAEAGKVDGDMGDDTYIAFGARIGLGETPFSQRSLFEIIPRP